jgi:alpha-tubulin suppressor-like RCC1 family protein
MKGLTGIVAIAAGLNFSLALDGSGNVWACGVNDQGQLGNGTTDPSLTPTPSLVTGATRIAASFRHALAIRTDGTVLAWGDNSSGQCGIGSSSFSLLPILVTR